MYIELLLKKYVTEFYIIVNDAKYNEDSLKQLNCIIFWILGGKEIWKISVQCILDTL